VTQAAQVRAEKWTSVSPCLEQQEAQHLNLAVVAQVEIESKIEANLKET
jgi:hypothetical protein